MSIDQFLLSADTTDLDYPEIRPTLDLNFARVKALDPRITFTRASGGSYVGADGLIKLAGVNEPRFDHDPVTGESLGLLIEESRTNFLRYSEDFTNAAWILFGTASRSANTTVAPDGNTTADTVTLPVNSGIYQFISASASTTYTFSVWIKANSTQNVNIVLNTNLSDPLESTVSVTTTWQRFSITKTTSVGTTTLTSQLSTGNGNTFFVWGAQTEVGAFPTSYIPTVASSRTRAADNASITGKNFRDFYRQDEGTILIDTIVNDNSAIYLQVLQSGNSLQDFMGLNNNNPGTRIVVEKNNIVQLFYVFSNITDGPKKWGLAYSFPSTTIFGAGSVRGDDDNNIEIDLPHVDTLTIGRRSADANFMSNTTFKSITYYPKRLPNQQLIALTR
jgi:hypothetical protein